MKSSTSIYYIEVQEGKTIKRVPHTKGTRFTEFMNRSQAVDFLNDLVANNHKNRFRLCKQTTTESAEKWQTSGITSQTSK